jgi:hypothetical protein
MPGRMRLASQGGTLEYCNSPQLDARKGGQPCVLLYELARSP